MPGAGPSKAKPYHWRVVFRPWLDFLRKLQGRWTTEDWYLWSLIHAGEYGLVEEVEWFFFSHLNAGIHPSIAALWALEEWDI